MIDSLQGKHMNTIHIEYNVYNRSTAKHFISFLKGTLGYNEKDANSEFSYLVKDKYSLSTTTSNEFKELLVECLHYNIKITFNKGREAISI